MSDDTTPPTNTTTIQLPLSSGYVALIDACDADLAQVKWSAMISPRGPVYAYRQPKIEGKQICVYLHRAIIERILGRSLLKGEEVDHVDRDGRNNTRANLRLATRSQQNANTKRGIRNTSGYKGVIWNKQCRKWQARIHIDGKQVHLGLFVSPEIAHAAYCRAAKEHFGEFANSGINNQ